MEKNNNSRPHSLSPFSLPKNKFYYTVVIFITVFKIIFWIVAGHVDHHNKFKLGLGSFLTSQIHKTTECDRQTDL